MPRTRSADKDDGSGSDTDESNRTVIPSPNITMSEEMFQTLVANITRSQVESNRVLVENMLASNRSQSTPSPRPETQSSRSGNFAKCTARFDGASKNADELEAFIDAIEIYRDCTNVGEEHALRGLPMLLTGEAAVWWQGVKSSVTSWSDALQRLRGMYGVPRPAYKIFREIFATEQSVERADVFICKVRALLAKLPYVVSEVMKLDIVYGLLDRRIRKRVSRDTVDGLEQLITKVRLVEESLAEVSSFNPSNMNNNTSSGVSNPFAAAKNYSSTTLSINPSSGVTQNINPSSAVGDHDQVNITKSNVRSTSEFRSSNTKRSNDSEGQQKRVRPKCAYCKLFGHSIDECRNKEKKVDTGSSVSNRSSNVTQLRCYGCGQLGVIRSKCETCKNTPSVSRSDTANFCSAHVSDSDDSLPLLEIYVADRKGVAILDTGATHSLAGPMLYSLLVDAGVEFKETSRNIGLADGSQHVCTALECDTTVTLEGRAIPTTFLVLPNARTRTLLGRDFIINARILLDLPQSSWSFNDEPQRWHPFITSFSLTTTSQTELMKVDTTHIELREDEGTKLTPSQRTQLNSLLIKRADRFAKEGPPTEYATHRLKIDAQQEPIASPPYRLSPGKKAILERELQKLLDTDVIEECDSPWAANVVLVTKKDGGVRLCVDYRKLNAVTEPDRYPLPRIEDVLHAAKNTSFMTTCDLRSGYFQIGVEPDDRDKTAFVSPLGCFRFKRMPMGLRNSGATFQRLMDRFKSGKELTNVSLLTYLDDVIILSESFPKHLEDLEAVFNRLEMYNLRINREKSCFARESVKFLGHVIVPGGIKADPDKTAAIANMLPPKNIKHVKTFLQTSSWFRRFIPNYAEVARPLTDLLKKDSVWTWTSKQQDTFERIKQLLISAPILRQADGSKPFTLRTDSSGYCLGAVLMQGEGPEERPVEYASRLLNSAERNYNTTEREALAVVWAVMKFRGYIEGSEVIVKSDHQPLRWLMNVKSPSGRLARWALTLQEYLPRIEYIPGKSNAIADTLSRPPCADEVDCDICYAEVDIPSRNPKDIRENQLKDPEVRKIVEDLESADDPFRGRSWSDRGFVMSDGILYRYGPEECDEETACLVVPEHEREKVLVEYHNAPTAGHFGVERTLDRVKSKYYWSGMRQSITAYLKKCIDCQRYKADNRKPAGLLQTPATNRRFEVVAVDLFGPLPETADKNKWILILEDTCSRWVELFALQNATSSDCAKILISEVFLRYGVPRRVISDNGVQFISEVMQQACHSFGITQSLSPVYHPQANPVERKNRDLKPQLAILVGRDHNTWDAHLPAIRFAMNSAVTSSTGYSPAYLTFGREMRAPADVITDMRAIIESDNVVTSLTPYLQRISTVLFEAREVHEKVQANQKRCADEGRRPAPDYSTGDLVLLKTQGSNDASSGQTPKFIPRRDGPYRVKEAASSTTYVLERLSDNQILGRYHVSQLTPFVGDVQPPVNEKRKRGRPKRFLD